MFDTLAGNDIQASPQHERRSHRSSIRRGAEVSTCAPARRPEQECHGWPPALSLPCDGGRATIESVEQSAQEECEPESGDHRTHSASCDVDRGLPARGRGSYPTSLTARSPLARPAVMLVFAGGTPPPGREVESSLWLFRRVERSGGRRLDERRAPPTAATGDLSPTRSTAPWPSGSPGHAPRRADPRAHPNPGRRRCGRQPGAGSARRHPKALGLAADPVAVAVKDVRVVTANPYGPPT
jgi:hypothetical protein